MDSAKAGSHQAADLSAARSSPSTLGRSLCLSLSSRAIFAHEPAPDRLAHQSSIELQATGGKWHLPGKASLRGFPARERAMSSLSTQKNAQQQVHKLPPNKCAHLRLCRALCRKAVLGVRLELTCQSWSSMRHVFGDKLMYKLARLAPDKMKMECQWCSVSNL